MGQGLVWIWAEQHDCRLRGSDVVLLSTHSRGGSPMFPLVVHQPASPSIWPAGSAHKSRGDNVVRIWVQLKRLCVSCVWMLQRGHNGDVCVLASTLCKYDLRKGDVFVLSCAKGATSEAEEFPFRAANVWWRCAQYFVIASCG